MQLHIYNFQNIKKIHTDINYSLDNLSLFIDLDRSKLFLVSLIKLHHVAVFFISGVIDAVNNLITALGHAHTQAIPTGEVLLRAGCQEDPLAEVFTVRALFITFKYKLLFPQEK